MKIVDAKMRREVELEAAVYKHLREGAPAAFPPNLGCEDS